VTSAGPTSKRLRYRVVPGAWAVCRLAPEAAVPRWARAAGAAFVSATRTARELSLVVPESRVPARLPDGKAERGWALLALEGPFAFGEIGVLAAVAAPLAAAGVPIFALSTFDTDHLLVPASRLGAALAALAAAGHEQVHG